MFRTARKHVLACRYDWGQDVQEPVDAPCSPTLCKGAVKRCHAVQQHLINRPNSSNANLAPLLHGASAITVLDSASCKPMANDAMAQRVRLNQSRWLTATAGATGSAV